MLGESKKSGVGRFALAGVAHRGVACAPGGCLFNSGQEFMLSCSFVPCGGSLFPPLPSSLRIHDIEGGKPEPCGTLGFIWVMEVSGLNGIFQRFWSILWIKLSPSSFPLILPTYPLGPEQQPPSSPWPALCPQKPSYSMKFYWFNSLDSSQEFTASSFWQKNQG